MRLRSFRERAIQTLALESGALLLVTPAYAQLFGRTVTESFMLMVALSLAVMLWSSIYNTVFDMAELRMANRIASDRPHGLRICHAFLHELTSALVTVPVIMLSSGFGFWVALALDVGLTLFYTAYSYIFHIVFDWLRPVTDKD